MSRDTSLTDFGTGADEADAESDERVASETDSEPADEDESLVDAEREIDPARATYDWTPGGAVCACCDESVETRWWDGDGMVCSDCKEW